MVFGAWRVPPCGATVYQDTDGDLLPDSWEVAHGLNPNDASDAELDTDHDLLTARDEFYAGTDPAVSTNIDAMSDRQILDLFKGKAFLYFWEQSHPPYYFTADNANYNDRTNYSNDFNSIASTGFALMSYVIAESHGWVDHQLAYQRVRTLLSRAVALQDASYDQLGVPASQQGNRHGYLYHFVDNQGVRHAGSEISSVDHALLVAGALVAGEYYQGTEVQQLAQQLFLNTDWNWLLTGNFLAQGWIEDPSGTFDGGRTLDVWNRYSELLILLTLAMGHPNPANGLSAAAWDALTYGTGRMFPYEYAHLFPGNAPQNFAFVPNMPTTLNQPGHVNSATEFHYLHAGSLHNHQYSHLFLDFRTRRDRWQTDFFANSISATMANRQFCINLNRTAFGGDPSSPDPGLRQPYETYGPNSWGLMAGLTSSGYQVMQPIVMSGDDFSPNNIAANNDSGTVVLSAPLGSTPFTPRQTVDMTRLMLKQFQLRLPGYDALVGRYGFRNAFNLGRTFTGQLGHFPAQIIGLDLGPVAGSVEDFETGLIWKLAMRNEFIQRGLQAAGFPTGAVEPFVLNFDDNPPSPQEDPNGGGQDPNSFGGTSYAWGSGSVAYQLIGDPFPNLPFGPQQWAQRISVSDGTASGAFTLLNNHSVSRWDRLSFWIKGETGTESFEVGLKDRVIDRLGNPLQATEAKLPIAAYHPNGAITTTWTEVRIPLQEFASRGGRLTELDNISFTNANPGGGTITVDDIAFLGDEFAPKAPTGFSAVQDGQQVKLAWQANPEPDVVGYKIYRSLDGGATFQSLTTLLTVGTAFSDPATTAGTRLYRVTAVDNAQPSNESAPSGSATVNVVTFDFSMTHNPPRQDIVLRAGKTGSTVIDVWQGPDRTSKPVTFTVSNLPAGATATVSPNPCPGINCSPTVTVVTSRSTPTGTSSITVFGAAGGLTRSTMFLLTVNPPIPAQTPWQSNAYGNLYTNLTGNYARGYHFTPLVNGQVIGLGGYFNGTKLVKLFNKATGQLLATATVSAANAWDYTAITPVSVNAGTTYTVAVYWAGSGGSKRANLNPPLPRTFSDIRIEASTYVYTGSNPNARPTNSVHYTMYGQADIRFSPD